MTSDAFGKRGTAGKNQLLFRSACIALAILATVAVLFLVITPGRPSPHAAFTEVAELPSHNKVLRQLLENPAAPISGLGAEIPHMEVVSWNPVH